MVVAHAQKSHSAPPSLPAPLVFVRAATTRLQLATVSASAPCMHFSLAHEPNSVPRASSEEHAKASASRTV
eukprot:scaffold13868_cov48-Phaeocystis_antarctica.AAC.1